MKKPGRRTILRYLTFSVLHFLLLGEIIASAPGMAAQTLGLGMCRPDFFQHYALYFYGNPNLDKSPSEHAPTDSVLFARSETGYQISSAPPWFAPAHMKMDYEILFLRAISLYGDFMEVVVNERSGRTAFVRRDACTLQFWPDFLLRVHSVEQLDPSNNPIRIKPLSHASIVPIPFVYLRPTGIRDQWLQVELLDDTLRSGGKGWIRWHDGVTLLLSYSLLS